MSKNITRLIQRVKGNLADKTVAANPGSEVLEKPMKSEAQRNLMQAAASGSTDKVPEKVAKEFIAKDKGGTLPEKVEKSEAKDDTGEADNGTMSPSSLESGPLNAEKVNHLVAEHKKYIKQNEKYFSFGDAKTAGEIEDELHYDREQKETGEGAVYVREDPSQSGKSRYEQINRALKKDEGEKLEKAGVPDWLKDDNFGKESKAPKKTKLVEQPTLDYSKWQRPSVSNTGTNKPISGQNRANKEGWGAIIQKSENKLTQLIEAIKKSSCNKNSGVEEMEKSEEPKESLRNGKDNSTVLGKVIVNDDGSYRWAKEGEKGYGVRKQSGYYRFTSGPYRGRYLHSIRMEKKTGQNLDKTSGKNVDHVKGDRSDLNELQILSHGEHSAKTNKTRAGKGFSGSKRYYHSSDKGKYTT